MARQYVVTEEEFMSLIESLKLEKMEKYYENGFSQEIQDMHRSFHYHVVRWVQDMGFKGHR